MECKSVEGCRRARNNLSRFYAQRGKKEREFFALEENLRFMKGELAAANNRLSRFQQASDAVGRGAISVALNLLRGDVRSVGSDVAQLAIEIAGLISGQQSKIQQLGVDIRNLENEHFRLNRELQDLKDVIRRAHDSANAHECQPPFN